MLLQRKPGTQRRSVARLSCLLPNNSVRGALTTTEHIGGAWKLEGAEATVCEELFLVAQRSNRASLAIAESHSEETSTCSSQALPLATVLE